MSIIGRKFGYLTVLSASQGKAECQCICGSIRQYYISNLQKTKYGTKSCGCKKREIFESTMSEKYGVKYWAQLHTKPKTQPKPKQYKYQELIGNKYGFIEVIEKGRDVKHVKCLCHACGQQVELRVYSIVGCKGRPGILSCGCQSAAQREDAMREKYGFAYLLQDKDYRDRLHQSFGVSNISQLDKIKEAKKSTYFSKTGYLTPSQNPQVKEQIYQNLKSRQGSKPELELLSWVKSFCSDAHKSYIQRPFYREIDIYCPGKCAIEYNGEYYHAVDRYHGYKYAHADITWLTMMYKKVHLVHVWGSRIKDNPMGWQNFLLSKLKPPARVYYARECRIAAIEKSLASSFCSSNHIQGDPVNFAHAYGLFSKDNELLGIATFSRHHRDHTDKRLVLSRLCFLPDLIVVGGLGKIAKHVWGLFGEFITYVDLSISSGLSYKKAGFCVDRIYGPDYFYWDKKRNKIVTKASRAKKRVKTPASMTEEEHAKADGLLKIYDSGKLRLVYNNSRQSDADWTEADKNKLILLGWINGDPDVAARYIEDLIVKRHELHTRRKTFV